MPSAHLYHKIATGGEIRVYRHTDGGSSISFETPLELNQTHIATSVILDTADTKALIEMLTKEV